ncbi:MAG: response regulator [Deltaproteobacteria bacterium]|nr:response regulator [Deltaproteobacteria bacterium]
MQGLKVLLVDDEEEFASTLAERLRLRDIVTLVANDGEQALRILETERPRVVVLDVMMPGLGGLDVLQRIRNKHPEIKTILLTGRGSTKDGIKGMRLGAYDYMMKPAKIEELIEKMKEAFEASKLETDSSEAAGK